LTISKLLALMAISLVFCQATVLYTVSGFSSGGFMAVQMHVAYSASIAGAGVIAGGPYYCSMGSLSRVQTACTANPYLINLASLTSYANIQASEGFIDPVSNLNQSKVFLYSALQDSRIFPGVVQNTLQFYQTFVQESNIMTVFDNNGVHTFPTISNGGPCWYYGSPYIGACNYDGAGALLGQLYGTLNAKVQFNNSNLFSFDQAAYADVWQAGLSNRGWVYAPYACRQRPISCRLHVVFHGCEQDYAIIGKTFMTEAGYGEWAESNNIVILFPQTTTGSVNYEGCWDFGGIFGPNFALQSGPQMYAVNQMAQNYTTIVQNVD